MINLTSHALKVRLVLEATDMRKSFNGLDGLAQVLQREGDHHQYLWIFSNKSRNRLKLLYYDRSGVWVAGKRLEQGTFSWPSPSSKDQQIIQLAPEAVQLLVDGVDLRDGTARPWWDVEKLPVSQSVA